MAVNYDINYDDSRFQKVESEKTAALNEMEKTYAGMINNSDKYYQQQIDASKNWADKQTQLQQEKTDFAIEEINQQKEQAKKDYTKEQSGAYVDWQKQSNEYGVNAEQMASSGMTNTGYSESSQVSMYNTYQNRVATARESYNLAIQNYNNAITEARLQNNSILAEIAYEALQTQLELSLQGFQYKNTLIQEKANQKLAIDSEYHNRYQDVLKQINTENALAEEVRQYNESLALDKQKLAEETRQFNEQMAFQREQFDYQKSKASSGGGSSSRRSSGGGGGGGGKTISDDNDNGKSINNSSSKSDTLPKATRDSIHQTIGGGAPSAERVAAAVKSGKVAETKNAKGETVFVKTGFGAGSAALSPKIPVKKASTATKLKNSIKNALKGIKGWFGG